MNLFFELACDTCPSISRYDDLHQWNSEDQRRGQNDQNILRSLSLSRWMHLSKEPSKAQGQWRATENTPPSTTPSTQIQSLHHSGNHHQLTSAAEQGLLGLNEESSNETPKSCGKETERSMRRWKDELLQLQGLGLLQQLDFSIQLFSEP